MVAGIRAARLGRSALIVEKSPSLGRKLLASGGQRCNLSNTLTKDGFMERVGRDGRFMGPALDELGGPKLREFFHGIGVQTVVLDGFRVWPETRKSATVLKGLLDELERLGVPTMSGCEVLSTDHDGETFGVHHAGGVLRSHELVLATGGLALPKSGASGGGYGFAESFGHRITARHPAGVPRAHPRGLARAPDRPHDRQGAGVRGDEEAREGRAHRRPDLHEEGSARPGHPRHLPRPLPAPRALRRRSRCTSTSAAGRPRRTGSPSSRRGARAPSAPPSTASRSTSPRDVAEVLFELAGVPSAGTIQGIKGGPKDALIQTSCGRPSP